MKEILTGSLILISFFSVLYYFNMKKINYLKNLFLSSYYFKRKKELNNFLGENFNEAIVIKTNFPGLYLIFNLDIFKFELKINTEQILLILDKFVLFFQKIETNINLFNKNITNEKIGFNYYVIKNFNYIPNIPANKFIKIPTENKYVYYLFYIDKNSKTDYPNIEMICNFKEKNCIRIENALININENIILKYLSNLTFYYYLNGKLKEIHNFDELKKII